jgi:membrane associated rhomboid family serine protease
MGTMGRTTFRPYVTFILLIINLVIFAVEAVVMARGATAAESFFGQYALSVCSLSQEPLPLTLRNAIFSMFLHGDLAHVVFNMAFLWIFAPRVEEYLGHRRFLTFYLLVGLIATIVFIVLGNVACPPAEFGADMIVGASGAIAGVMGAFLWLYPGARIRTFVVFRELPLPAFLYLGLWVATDIVAVIVSEGSRVAHHAHIGGFFAGMAILFVATLFKPAPAGNPLQYLDD